MSGYWNLKLIKHYTFPESSAQTHTLLLWTIACRWAWCYSASLRAVAAAAAARQAAMRCQSDSTLAT